MLVAVVVVLRAVGHGVGSHEHVARSDAGNVAAVAGKHVGVLHRTECVLKTRHVGSGAAARAQMEHDGLRARFPLDRAELLLDHRVGFVPRDALPFVRLAAVLRVALHGVQNTVGVIHRFLQSNAASAKAALIVRAFLVAFDLDELPRFLIGVNDDAAAIVAAGSGPCARAGADHAVLFPLPRQIATRVFNRRLAEKVWAHLVGAALLDFHVNAFRHTSLLSKAFMQAFPRAPKRAPFGFKASGPLLGFSGTITAFTLMKIRFPCMRPLNEARRQCVK